VSDQSLPAVPLPSGWAENVKSAVLHVISLAHFAIVEARGWAANAVNPRARQAAEIDRLTGEVALLQEQIRIQNARMAKVDPRHRPYYPPTERMAILELKAARGWSLAQTARVFLVEDDTIATWLKRIDGDGSHALVQLGEPVNKFPDFAALSSFFWIHLPSLSLSHSSGLAARKFRLPALRAKLSGVVPSSFAPNS